MFNCVLPQERQRLETILTLCAEYNKGEDTGQEPLSSARSGRRPSLENVLGGTASSAALHLAQKQRENDEENLKEECSSTESTHQEVRTSPSTAALLSGDRQVREFTLSASCMPLWNQHELGMCLASLTQWFEK